MAHALLLSGPFGLGHEMPERSFRALLQGAGWSVRALNSMALLGHGERAGQRVFAALMAIPGVYDGLHFAHLRTGSALARAMNSAAAARTVSALRAELDRQPADVVISVFAAGAGAAARLKETAGPADAGPSPRTVVYCPDVAAHRLWVHEGTDLFLVTSPAAAASVRRFRPRAPIAVVPPPVRRAFYDAPSRREARAQLVIPEDARCALLIDSGWGLAPITAAAAGLADAGVHVLAVAGRNKRLERELREAARRRPLLAPFGFTSEVPLLMAAADLVVSLPGATTCSEARVVGRPLLLLDVMPGHGRDNLLHELEQGSAGVCGPRAADVCAGALAMLGTAPAPDPGHAPPRWEPAYSAALARIGLDIAAGPRTEEECAPCSLTRPPTKDSTAGQEPATRQNVRSARSGIPPGSPSPRRWSRTACSLTPRRRERRSRTSCRWPPAATSPSSTPARPPSRGTSGSPRRSGRRTRPC